MLENIIMQAVTSTPIKHKLRSNTTGKIIAAEKIIA